MHVAVIGAGVMGAASALYLARAGHQVTVLDRRPAPGLETSFANGGLLHASHAAPWNSPGVLLDILRWIGREDAPFLIRPAALAGSIGWGLRFIANSRPKRFAQHTRANAALAAYSLKALQTLLADESLSFDYSGNGILKLFRTDEQLQHGQRAARSLAQAGVRSEVLTPGQIVEREPALAEGHHELTGAVYFPDDASGDAQRFCAEAIRRVTEHYGGTFRGDVEVHRLRRRGGAVHGVSTNQGPIDADSTVLANGTSAAALARSVGMRLPIHPVKGYSVSLPLRGTSGVPRIPYIDDGHKVVVAILGETLRIAGTAEIAGYDTTLRRARAQSVRHLGLAAMPALGRQLADREGDLWAGLRPMTADGPPVLGPSALPGLHLAAGAGHLGWTFAAGAGKLVADGVDGRRSEIDPRPYSPQRFPGPR